MIERNLLDKRKKEEKLEKLKDINNKRKEELLKNKPKDSLKNKERKRNNFNFIFSDLFDFKYNYINEIILFLEVILWENKFNSIDFIYFNLKYKILFK